MKNVLVAVDFSESSKKVVNEAHKLSIALGGNLALLHVLPNPGMYSVDYTPIEGFTNLDLENSMIIAEELRKNSESKMDQLIAEMGIDNAQPFFMNGNIKDSILELSEEWGADVIVVGSHNNTGFFHFIEGDTSIKLVHKSKKLILVVPEDLEE